MRKSVRSRAEEQFAATQKKAKQTPSEKEKSRQEIAERVARLRALRLAKEAADKEAAEEAKWLKIKPSAGAATPRDHNAELIAEALGNLVQSGGLKIPRGGYVVTRGRGRVVVTRAKG